MKFNLKKTIAGISALALAATQITVMVANAADSASAKKITLDSVTKFEKAGAVIDGDTAYATWNKETYKLLQSATGFDSAVETSYGKVNVSIEGGEISLEGNVDLSKQFATKIEDQIKNKLDGYTISDSDIDVKGNVEITLTYGGLKDGYSLGVTTAKYTDGDTTIDLKSVDTNKLKEYSNSKLAEIKENIKADLKQQVTEKYGSFAAGQVKYDELEAVVDDYATKAESKISKLDKTVSVENAATADDAIAELAKKAGTQSINSVDSFFSKNIIANTVTSALNVISQKAGEASKGKYEVAISEDDVKSFAKAGTNVSATYSTSASSTSFNFEDDEKSFELDGKTYEIVDGKKLFEAKYTGSEVEVKVSAKVKEKTEETTETTETTPAITTAAVTTTGEKTKTTAATKDTTVTTASTKNTADTTAVTKDTTVTTASTKNTADTTAVTKDTTVTTASTNDTTVTTVSTKNTVDTTVSTKSTADTTVSTNDTTVTTVSTKNTADTTVSTTDTTPTTSDDGKNTTTSTNVTTAQTSVTTSVSGVDVIKDAKVVYADSSANANFYFSTEKAYTFVIRATVNGKEKDLDAKNISYSIGNKKVTSPADTFQKGTHKYELDVLYNGKSLGVKATAYIGVRGDANLDDEVNSKDAVKVLQYHAATMAYAQDHKTVPVLYKADDAGHEALAKFLGNANLSKDKAVDAKDSVVILKFYAQDMVHAKNPAEKEAVWEDMYKAEN